MVQTQIILQGITPDQLYDSLISRLDQRLADLVNKPEPEPIKYLTRQETADLLSISLVTLHDWSRKKILNPYRLGNRVYYRSDEIDQSLKQINQ